MKTSFFITLFFLFSSFNTFAQEESSEKITCQKLISDHIHSCDRCIASEKCEVRKDLLKFCSQKEQELVVIESGPILPNYQYYLPDMYPYYNNNGWQYREVRNYCPPVNWYGNGVNFSAGISGGFILDASYQGFGGYNNSGVYNSHGANNNYGSHQNNGSNNTKKHYGSRRR